MVFRYVVGPFEQLHLRVLIFVGQRENRQLRDRIGGVLKESKPKNNWLLNIYSLVIFRSRKTSPSACPPGIFLAGHLSRKRQGLSGNAVQTIQTSPGEALILYPPCHRSVGWPPSGGFNSVNNLASGTFHFFSKAHTWQPGLERKWAGLGFSEH